MLELIINRLRRLLRRNHIEEATAPSPPERPAEIVEIDVLIKRRDEAKASKRKTSHLTRRINEIRRAQLEGRNDG